MKVIDGVPEYRNGFVSLLIHLETIVNYLSEMHVVFSEDTSYCWINVHHFAFMQDVIARVVRKEGFLSLWKGFTPCYMRIGPHTVLTFIFLEQLQLMAKKAYGVQ
jgi:hypothetical protein